MNVALAVAVYGSLGVVLLVNVYLLVKYVVRKGGA